MTDLAAMMPINTATKLITLFPIIDDKKKRANNVNNNPLATNLQWNILESTVVAVLTMYPTFKDDIHDFVEVARRTTTLTYQPGIRMIVHGA